MRALLDGEPAGTVPLIAARSNPPEASPRVYANNARANFI